MSAGQMPDETGRDMDHMIIAPAVGQNIKLLLKPLDAADALSISPRKLWAMTNSGEIPCVRFGRSVRYDPMDLREWIDQRKGGR
jgi:excisionase family DNA binding protein